MRRRDGSRGGENAEEETRRQLEEDAGRRAAEQQQRAATRKSVPSERAPGTVFRDIDAPWCPELVVIPPGEFVMGSSEDDRQGDYDEKPQHRVRIA